MKTVLRLLDTHLLAAIAIACIAGITLSTLVLLPTHLALNFAAAAAALLLFCIVKNQQLPGLFSGLLLFFLAGLYLGTVSSREPENPEHIYNLITEPTDGVLVGRLLAMPLFDGKTSQVRIDLQSFRPGVAKPHVPAHGTVLLRLPAPWPHQYPPGTLLAIRALLQRPVRYGVPGVFDYPAHLARQDIWITGYLRSPAQLHQITTTPSGIERLRFLPEQLRTSIGEFLDSHTDPTSAGLYRALLLGDSSRISYDLLEKFKACGTMHILAISGIQLTIIGTLLFFLIYWLLRRSVWLILNCNLKKISGLICLPLLIGYTLLAGGNAPVVRACTMSLILILALCTDRQKTISALIAFGALFILVLSPQALFTASFQLTFAAFISILLPIPLLQPLLLPVHRNGDSWLRTLPARLRNWSIGALLASVAAVLGTAPIVIYHFFRFSLAGPFATLVQEPLICLWTLPLGFLALPCIAVAPQLASLLLSAGNIGLHLAVWSAGVFQAIPQATLWLPRPDPLLIVGYYFSFILAFVSWQKPTGLASRAAASLPFVVCLFVLLNPAIHLSSDKTTSTVVHILDVGQGSATLIGFEDGTHMLIDGGGSVFSKESVGQQVIAPFLWSKGVTRLETIVLTHPDADHYNGVPFLIEHFSPKLIWTSTATGGAQQFRDMLAVAKQKGITVRQAELGMVLRAGTTSVHCLANTAMMALENGGSRNDGLVVQLATESYRLLFPGDIESETENQLAGLGVRLRSDILLAAHHGSATSNSSRFLQQVDPRVMVVSAGRSRESVFPGDPLRKYCKIEQLPLYITAESGTIRIEQRGDATEIFVLKDLDGNPLRRQSEQWLTAQVIGSGN